MAQINSKEELERALATVARDGDGNIIVLSPYGFHIQNIKGQDYVVSLTKEEYEQMIHGMKEHPKLGQCYTPAGGGYCVQGSCERYCVLVFGRDGQWHCICSY